MNPRHPWFTAGFVAGCLLGAAGALLTAPTSGAALLAALREHLEQAKRDAREAGQRAEAEILTRYLALRDASGAGQVPTTSGVYVSPREGTTS
jgi:gas vesicle protein